MKKYTFIILSVCSLLVTLSAEEMVTSPFSFEVTQGLRRDRFHASAKPKHLPFKANIKGHATLKNIDIHESHIRTQVSLANCFLRLDGSYGEVLKRDAKYSILGIYGHHAVKGGRTWDAKASFGRECFFNKRTSISPMFGYIGGEERVHFDPIKFPKLLKPFVRRFKLREKLDLDKIVHSRLYWHAPFVGVGFKTKPGKNWTLYGEYNFAYIPLKRIKGTGHVGIVSLGYDITKHVMVKAEYEQSHMKVHYANHYITAHASKISSVVRLALNIAV